MRPNPTAFTARWSRLWNSIQRVRLVFNRELRDQLRDRRTLFMVVVLPLALYPALGLGLMHMSMMFAEQPRTVVVLGADFLPNSPSLLKGDGFANELFADSRDAAKLRVVSDSETPATSVASASPGSAPNADVLEQAAAARQRFLDAAQHIRIELIQARELQLQRDQFAETEQVQAVRLDAQLLSIQRRLGDMFAASGIQSLVIVPREFAPGLAAANAWLRDRTGSPPSEYPRPAVVYNRADDKSSLTYSRVKEVVAAWESQLLDGRLAGAGLPASLPHPVRPLTVNLALDEQVSANLWGKLFPALLVMMTVTGAFYPAIDLVAGEKERGTMETLLISPAGRNELVLGKFFAVVLFSATTAALNLASMGFTGTHMMSMAPAGMLAAVELSLPGGWPLVWVSVALVPLAALFSAVSLAIATFARSNKEGQYYLTPLLMIVMGLTVMCMSPGVELRPQYCLVPVVGVMLLLKSLLGSASASMSVDGYIFPVMFASFVYSGLALWWAMSQFRKESVLFRETERFELRLWVRHLLRDKEPLPCASMAVFCFGAILFLQFVAMSAASQTLATLAVEGVSLAPAMQRTMLVQQIAFVGLPAVIMAVVLTRNPQLTLRLAWPGWSMLALSVGLAAALHPVAIEVAFRMQPLFEPLPENVRSALQQLGDPSQPLWLTLLVFALVPALCEELAFRGFILSGLSRGRSMPAAVVISSLMFGAMHLLPQQVFNAALVGLVVGVLAARTRSLLPAIVFHFAFNGLAVLHGRTAGAWPADATMTGPVYSIVDGQVRYGWPLLILAAIAATVLLLRLLPIRHCEDVVDGAVSGPFDVAPPTANLPAQLAAAPQ